MTKQTLENRAKFWLAVKGLKVFPSFLCKDVCRFYKIRQGFCELNYSGSFRACIKWLDDVRDNKDLTISEKCNIIKT